MPSAPSAHDHPAHPNLVFVFCDQMRGSALGCLGEEPTLTPRLDRFAVQSLVLPQCASNYPICSPYRAMLMTGMYPHRNGVLGNSTSEVAEHGCELRKGDRCWSDVLKDQGYSLGYIGKWHLDCPRPPFVTSPNNRPEFAWNEWTSPDRRHGFGYWHAYGTFDLHLTPEYWDADSPRDRRVKGGKWGPEHEADLAIKYLRNLDGSYRRRGEPFALVVAMNPPHTPYDQVPKRYLEAYGDKSWRDLDRLQGTRPNLDEPYWNQVRWLKHYFAGITGVDDQFGRIVDEVDRLGIARDTIVVFTSDHGNCLGSHGEQTKDVPWEESMRVPFLVRWPGRIPPRHDNLLMSSPDIYPTLLDLMGLRSRIPATVEGASHAAIFQGREGKRPTSQLYMRVPVWQPPLGHRGVRTDRYTLVRHRQVGSPERITLHDRKTDPYQLRDIALDRPDLVERLTREELEPWLGRTGDPWMAARP